MRPNSNHGTEDVEENPYVSGNVEPHRGFGACGRQPTCRALRKLANRGPRACHAGHVAVMCKDVYAACEVLEKNGVKFQKRPDEVRCRGGAAMVTWHPGVTLG